MNHFSDQNSSALAIETELPLSTSSDNSLKRGWAKRIVLSKMSQLKGGQILLDDAGQTIRLGQSETDGFTVRLKVAQKRFIVAVC